MDVISLGIGDPDTPTPAGPTPRQIGVPPTATVLPIVSVRHADGS